MKVLLRTEKGLGRPRVTSSRENHLLRDVDTRSPMGPSKKFEAKLKEIGTVVSTKIIQRRLFQ